MLDCQAAVSNAGPVRSTESKRPTLLEIVSVHPEVLASSAHAWSRGIGAGDGAHWRGHREHDSVRHEGRVGGPAEEVQILLLRGNEPDTRVRVYRHGGGCARGRCVIQLVNKRVTVGAIEPGHEVPVTGPVYPDVGSFYRDLPGEDAGGEGRGIDAVDHRWRRQLHSSFEFVGKLPVTCPR